jgi:hypothetical protein
MNHRKKQLLAFFIFGTLSVLYFLLTFLGKISNIDSR